MGEFQIYRGSGTPDDEVDRIRLLSDPPPWRVFDGAPLTSLNRDDTGRVRPSHRNLALSYQADPDTVTLVNVALHLRRPLLVTGYPGTGKSALAYAVAHELRLGPVLRWPITSRSTLKDGLYRYDAVGRIEEASLAQQARMRALDPGGVRIGAHGAALDQGGVEPDAEGVASDAEGVATGATDLTDVGRFIRLGPLGTALAPYELPRVLLIDEIDKSDIDLPNDLLNVFEEGEYDIPELVRISDATPRVQVRPADDGAPVTVVEGQVTCHAFPFVVMTSNGEREFPPAFLRRCIRLELPQPDQQRTAAIVRAHLGEEAARQGAELIEEFLARRERGQYATDQLLSAVYLLYQASGGTGLTREDLVESVLRELGEAG